MMSSPPRAKFHSDAEPTVVINSCSNAPKSPSDHSRIISDPILLERELAFEVLQKASAISEQTDDLRPTIAYEEALERELEYQKRVKMFLLKPNVGSPFLTASFQPSSSGVKRKAVCGALDRTASGCGHASGPPLSRLRHWHSASQLAVQSQHPSLQQLPGQQRMGQRAQVQNSLSQGLNNRHTLEQGIKCGQAWQKLVHAKKTNYQPNGQQYTGGLNNQRQPKPQVTPFWCYLCKVDCSSPHNFKCHCEGKKHKAKLELLKRKTSSMKDIAGRVTGQAGSSKLE